jgi:voltage-gated potassium channel
VDEARLQVLRPFGELTPAQRKMLARLFDELRAPAGATLVSEGDAGYEFMVIEEGTVEVLRDGERVEELGPGDFFGELAVAADGGTRNATVVACSDVRLLTLTAHYMRQVRERMPLLGEQIDRAVQARRDRVQ